MKRTSDAVMFSMQQRGDNSWIADKVIFANRPVVTNSCEYKGVYEQTIKNIEAILPDIEKLYKTTNKPVYIVGPISTTMINGKPHKLPNERHAFNRRPFAIVQRALLARKVYAINPAHLSVFKRTLKAPKDMQAANNGPAIFNATAEVKGHERCTKNLHRANKRAVRGCCCIVMVRHQASLTSIGVL